MTQPVTTDRLNEFLANLNAMYANHHIVRGYNFPAPTFTAQAGVKNIRIVQKDNPESKGGSVYCFIKKDNGDILKAAGWNAPAKGARGSIWNADCDVGVDKPCNMYGSGLYIR